MCSGDLETIDHLMWGCRMIQNRVEWLQEFVFPTENKSGGLLQAIDDCLRIHGSCPVNLLLLLEHCKCCWNERNKFVFEGVTGRTTPWRVIATVKTEVSCLSRRWVEEKRADFVEQSAQAIEVAEVSLRSMLRRQREMDLLVQEFDPSASPRQRRNVNERSRIRERDSVSNPSDQNLDIAITQEDCSESQSISSYDNTMSSSTGEERIVDVAEVKDQNSKISRLDEGDEAVKDLGGNQARTSSSGRNPHVPVHQVSKEKMEDVMEGDVAMKLAQHDNGRSAE
ncbi:hypothetical protein R1sor_023907 [Riccia sorocarpa]|uniref:Reverse transcriptase zinc-binding domain-containing protein n=1 Tax=Riccia sorocarpa TaxID=122646 RepID=A0ABD3GT07_9MARC